RNFRTCSEIAGLMFSRHNLMNYEKRARNTQFSLRRGFARSALACAFIALPVFATHGEAPPPRALNVSGEGVVALPLRFAHITVSVTSREKTAAAAQADTAGRADRLVKTLKAESVSQLKTVRVALHTIVDDKKTGRTVEYFSSNTLSFRVAIERAGRLLDRAVASGADHIDQVQLIPDDAELAAARKQAMAAAAQDAREKADVVLSALGLRAKDIRQINVDVQFASPSPMQTRQRLENSANTPIVGGDTEARAVVHLTVGY
ncbi:MAG: SIMPL domain-containing protein, partial [Leptospirales bacterium]